MPPEPEPEHDLSPTLAWSIGASALCTVIVLVVYATFGQDVFYKTDGPYLVLNLAEGRIEHPYNAAYMPLLAGLAWLCTPLEPTAYHVAVLLSALGTALGVGFACFGFARLGLPRSRALLATSLVALCPPVFFFATVVEHHGPFFAAAGLCFVLFVELCRRPSWPWAVALGVATHGAYVVHGTGNLLPAVLLPWFVARGFGLRSTRPDWLRRDLGLAALAGALHLGLWWLLKDVELPDQGGTKALALVFGEGIGRPRGLVHLPEVSWQEWFGPFLPLSVSCLAAFWVRRLWPEAFGFLIGLTPFLALCVLLIVGEEEFGAYLLPLAIPAAWLTVRALPRWTSVALAGVSLALAVAAVERHDDPFAYRSWARGLDAAAAGREPVLVLGGTEEIAFCLRERPEVRRFLATDLARAAGARDDPDRFAAFDAAVGALQAAGAAVFLTEGGRVALADPEIPAGADLVDHVRTRYRVEEVEFGRFRAWSVSVPG